MHNVYDESENGYLGLAGELETWKENECVILDAKEYLERIKKLKSEWAIVDSVFGF